MDAEAKLSLCHRCKERVRPCAGVCICKVNGKDIQENARGDCPKGFFVARGKSPAEIEVELERLGYDPDRAPGSPKVGGCCDPPRA